MYMQCPTCRSVAAEGYQVPFQGMVPPEPSLEDMQRLVVDNRVQPTISNRWTNSKVATEPCPIYFTLK